MKLKRFACVLMTLTIALSGLTTGCTSGDKDGKASSSITIGIPQDLDSLDPHKAVAAGTKEILFNIYEGLVKVDSDGNLVPAVASEVSPSEDGSSYTFTLRDGVKFHDGSAVTAEDVKYSLDRCAASDGDSAPLVPAFSNIKSVDVKDAKTVTVNLENPDTEFLANLTTAIIPASNKEPEKNAIGTGPYKYVSWTPLEQVVLKKNEDYWGEKAYITDVTIKIIADGDSIVTALNGGSIDFFARLSADQVSQLSGDFTVYEGTMNLVQALYLNNAEKPFDDVRVRQALCYATDVKAILDMTSDGKGTPIGSSMFPAFGKYYTDLSNTYPKDIEKAKALLKEAGYEDGFTFTITVPSNYQPHIDTALVLKEQYKEIGVTAEIQKVEWATWLSDVYTGRQFTSTVIGVDASTLTAPALLSRFVSDAGNNFINYNNADYDAAYARAIKTTDDAEKTAAYKECEKILADTAANVYIQDMAEFVALNKKYTGYTFYPLYVQDLAKIKPADAK
ncbi:MAG: ABC transporter substrate-binding protein [Lachnospiraceae bacterium]|nr:ABC transporter substrate-binding protein [Lachnospiraceae bacterium]